MDAASIPSPLELRPLAILVESIPRQNAGLARVFPTDEHILFYRSDVTVISENQDNSIGWHGAQSGIIAVAVTFEAGNEHLIRYIRLARSVRCAPRVR